MKIFISSTFEDLKEHRRAVRDAILQLGHHPIAMEYFGARSTDPQTAALDEIEKCDAFVGIYAYRFGWVPDGDTRSITEQEFDFARAHNIPSFCYRVKKDFPWEDSLKETGTQADGLALFLVKIDSKLVRAEFTTPEDLAAKVAADLGRELAKPTPPKTREERNYHAMLKRVKRDWIVGSLEKSLQGNSRIQIDLVARQDCVENAWADIEDTHSSQFSPIPPGSNILDICNDMEQELLILGSPGSGKTILLLELTQMAIAQAEKDPSYPIPVILKLSSWSERKLVFERWLVDELNKRYDIDYSDGQRWIAGNNLFLLLDGLDEVGSDCLKECIEHINNFVKSHGFVSIVVTSRTEPYEQSNIHLRLRGAIQISLLRPQQIHTYLILLRDFV